MNKTVLKEIELDYAANLIINSCTANLYFKTKDDGDIKKFDNYNVPANDINKRRWFLMMEQ